MVITEPLERLVTLTNVLVPAFASTLLSKTLKVSGVEVHPPVMVFVIPADAIEGAAGIMVVPTASYTTLLQAPPVKTQVSMATVEVVIDASGVNVVVVVVAPPKVPD